MSFVFNRFKENYSNTYSEYNSAVVFEYVLWVEKKVFLICMMEYKYDKNNK